MNFYRRERKEHKEGPGQLLKIIDHDAFAYAFEHLLHKVDMQGMHLVIILGLLIRKHDVQGHLLSLIHHRPMAGSHPADVEMQHAGNGLKILIGARNQFFGCRGNRRVGPKYDNVRETGHKFLFFGCARRVHGLNSLPKIFNARAGRGAI